MPSSAVNKSDELLVHSMDFVGKGVNKNSGTQGRVGGGFFFSFLVNIYFKLNECKDRKMAMLQWSVHTVIPDQCSEWRFRSSRDFARRPERDDGHQGPSRWCKGRHSTLINMLCAVC